MVREPLILKTDNGTDVAALLWEDNTPILWEDGTEIALERQDGIPFKGIEITEYSFKSPRMGMPTLTAELYWPTCLDDEWTGKEFVELRGERYYLRQIQSSEISNNNVIKYKHSLEFKSEREILSHVYFYDAVPSVNTLESAAGHDKPCTNSTNFKFFGTIYEYADRLNCAFRYAGIGDSILQTKTHLTDADTPTGDGYCVVVSDTGDGDLTQSQNFEFEDQWLWDALSEGFDKFKIPFVFHGKKIVFNEQDKVVSHVFKYGFDNELLSIKKNNANAKIINRITFKGSSENIPYHYPNTTEYGNIVLAQIEGDDKIPTNQFELINPSKLVKWMSASDVARLNVYRITEIEFGKLSYKRGDKWIAFEENQWVTLDFPTENNGSVYFSTTFTTPQQCDIVIDGIYGKLWKIEDAPPSADFTESDNLIKSGVFTRVSLTNAQGEQFTGSSLIVNGKLIINRLPAGTYTFMFRVDWGNIEGEAFFRLAGIKTAVSAAGLYYWTINDKRVNNLEDIGVRFNGTPNDSMLGGGFKWTARPRMPFQTNLMPPKYRATNGDERYYNALNDTYDKPSGGKYIFKNPYIDGDPNEYIFTDETIKPTIEGVENASEQLFGEIAAIAYDSDDNDSLKAEASEDKEKNDAANYAHSFFYIKLNKFDGPFGFNLFDAASQTDPMTIQMTSGPCDGCKFKVQVAVVKDGDIEVWRNPVQVKEADGDIVDGSYSAKIDADNPQSFQQNSKENSIWLCVQKDAETFGVIMPNRSHNYMPAVGDTFNIINIDLPQGYIDAAEERGMYAMLDFMENNNEEKFNFDISASRIFFANNPDLLDSLDENSRIKIEYDGKIYEQYVSELAIDCKDNEVLPDVKITLADTLSPTGSFVQEVVAQAADISKAVTNRPSQGGGVALDVTDTRYLRRDMDDRTEHRVSSDTAFEVGTFVSGSQGAILSIDPETGKTLLEADYVRARMKAIYESIEVANVRSIGGKQTISPGGSISISFVDELDSAYRCYFKRKEDEKSADCRFIVGDDAYCQSFNVSNGTTQTATDKFYWRAVTAVSNDGSYIELSKTDCATGSAAPEIGDVICQLGSDDTSRQSAIILSTVDEQSPNITLYDGITNFTLNGKEVVDMGVDEATGKAYFHVYGNAYIGDKDGASYIKYDNILKELLVKAKLTVDSTVGDDVLADYIKKVSPPVEQEDIEGFVNNIVNPKIEGLQNQIDGVIETWFGNGEPALDVPPASEWNTDNLKIAHLGDLYYDNDTGTAYRFSQNEQGGYFWNTITDDAIANALAAAQRAQDTADHKRRVFTAQPTAQQVYDVGDLWVNATYGEQYNNDLLRCVAHKGAGAAFNIAHWTLASKYTDDTLAQEAKAEIAGFEYLKEAMADGITQFNGGLMLSSHIRLGEWNADKTAMEHVYAGMNGIYQNGRSLASWWGGDMVDLFNENDVRINPEPANGAKALVRMDGSAYFSHGNIGFKKDGSGWLGNDLTGIKFTPDGTMTLGSGIQVGGGGDSTGVQQTLADVLNFNAGLTKLLKPYGSDNQPLSWAEAAESDGAGGIKAKTLRASVTFASVGDIVAYQNGNLSGGTGGSGLDITALEDYLTTNGYATQAWVSAHFNDYVLTKAAVEAVLTGNITTHTHNQYLTEHQSLANYMTRGEIGDTYQAKSTALSFTAAEGYVAARFTNTALATSAAQNYIELWGTDGWFNLQSGYLLAHGAVTATSFVKTGGTATQFLKADGSVDSNTYLTTGAASDTYLPKATYTASDILTKIKTVDGAGSGLDADTLDGVHGKGYMYYNAYNFSNGCLVRLKLLASGNDMVTVHIHGNSYHHAFMPIDTWVQFYHYKTGDAIVSEGAINNGYDFGNINVFCYDGHVYLWFKQTGNYQSFSVYAECTNEYFVGNLVENITNAAMPTEGVTRLVTITPKQSALTTDNVASATKLKTARTINGTAFDGTAAITTAKWGTARNLTIGNTAKSVDGSSAMAWSLAEIGALGVNANAVSASKLQTARTIWGQSFDGTDNVAGTLSGVEDITFNANAKIAATDNHLRLLTKSGGTQGLAVGGLLASNTYIDWSKVPANGIYSKGNISTDGSLKIGGGTITWDAGNNAFMFSHTVASQGDMVAFQNGNLSGGTGGGGLDITALEDYLTTNGYATQDWVAAHFNDYVLTKAAVEAVLTGNITSHTHSQYLTEHQSLANYYTKTESDGKYLTTITKSMVEAVLTGNITTHTHSQYLTAHQSLANYYTKAEVNTELGKYLLSSAYTASDILTKIKTVDGAGSGLDADTLDGVHGKGYMYYNAYNFSNGYLVRLKLLASGNDMVTVHIHGNSYHHAFMPIDTWVQFYHYKTGDAIVSEGAINNGYDFGNINVFCYDGHVYLWFKQTGNYQSFSVFAEYMEKPHIGNLVESITNEAMPTEGVTRLVTITPKQSALTTDNVASATKLKTARTINGTAFDGTAAITTAKWGTARNLTIGNTAKSVDGSSAMAWSLAEIGALGVNANAVSASKLQTAHTLWGQSFDGTKNISGALSAVTTIDMTGDILQGDVRYGRNNGMYAEIRSGGNELVISGKGTETDMYVNYRASGFTDSTVPQIWRWMAGSGSTWANHEIGGLTTHGEVKLPYIGDTYLSMATRENVIKGARNNSATNAHALLRIINSNGAAWVVGGTGKDVGIYGFTNERITNNDENAPSWKTTWDADTGELSHSGAMNVQSLKIGGGTITWDEATNSFIFSHTIASQGNVVAFKE